MIIRMFIRLTPAGLGHGSLLEVRRDGDEDGWREGQVEEPVAVRPAALALGDDQVQVFKVGLLSETKHKVQSVPGQWTSGIRNTQ